MNTNEDWRDEHERKYQQWESDKAVISDKSRKFYALVAEKYHGVYPVPVLAQQYFRMLWLGEYLRHINRERGTNREKCDFFRIN